MLLLWIMPLLLRLMLVFVNSVFGVVVGTRKDEDDDDVVVAVTDGVAVLTVVAAVEIADSGQSSRCRLPEWLILTAVESLSSS